jgi:hypothetical protein
MFKKKMSVLIMRKGLAILKGAPSDALVANHAVILRESSAKTMQKYARLMDKTFFVFVLAKTFLSCLMKFFQRWCYASDVSRYGVVEKAKVVFFSHLTDVKQLTNNNDPYFGDLPIRLSSSGVPVVTALTNQSGICVKTRDLEKMSILQRIWVLPRGIYFLNGVSIFWQMIKESFRLLKMKGQSKNRQERDYFQALSVAQLDHHSFDALILSNKILQICEELQPAAVVITFEGYPWERLACRLVHNKFPNTVIIGYLHAAISDGPRAINHKFGGGMDPDHFLCAGRYMKQKLVKEGDFKLKNYTVIGSPKFFPQDNSRMRHLFDSQRCILAVPEGMLSETLILGRALAQLAAKLPKMRCILRLHPVLSKVKLLRCFPEFSSAPRNFEISSQLLKRDIEISGWVIYRGSSAVLAAISGGLRPLYFDHTDSNYGDVIDANLSWRIKCASVTELATQILKDIGSSKINSETDGYELVEAQKFVNSYYSFFDVELAIKCLSKYG